jgi:Uma2 family endonuclease
MPTSSQAVTADELIRLPSGRFRYELVRGELRTMSLAGGVEGVVSVQVAVRLAAHVEQHRLGIVFCAGTGFHLEHDPDTVLAPDVAFVALQHIPAAGIPTNDWQGAPDLAVEVNSPGDRAGKVAGKSQAWLAHGARQVWIVDPQERTVTIHHADGRIVALGETDTLEGGDLVPGFACRVGEIFPPERV